MKLAGNVIWISKKRVNFEGSSLSRNSLWDQLQRHVVMAQKLEAKHAILAFLLRVFGYEVSSEASNL